MSADEVHVGAPDGVPDLGVKATVVVDRETWGPAFVTEEERQELIDAGVATDEFDIVSIWTFHVALYALQNPTPENILRALAAIGTSGDCEECIDEETFLPFPVPKPNGWDDIYVMPAARPQGDE